MHSINNIAKIQLYCTSYLKPQPGDLSPHVETGVRSLSASSRWSLLLRRRERVQSAPGKKRGREKKRSEVFLGAQRKRKRRMRRRRRKEVEG